jgi:hypothetical protein
MRLLLAETQIGSRTYPDCDLPGLILESNEQRHTTKEVLDHL